ncbi:MAG: substrate-binding domain-containing protein [Clostridia bacterium]|nr:substrate-binding domain-containing protein [Clostridia bacterium]
MIKRILSSVIGIMIAFAGCIPSGAEAVQSAAPDGKAFEIIHIPYETEGDYDWRITIKARYKDTKEAITLSEVYDGRVYAAVPKENADREIEAFEAEQLDFTDYNDSDYEFYVFKDLSKTGVILGNDKGEALPFENITRAEATAMLMRLLGLENVPKANAVVNFEDVSKNDWFYSAVMSAYDCGIIEGDSGTSFSPNRNITREEFTVMAARAVQYAGLGYPGDNYMNVSDYDKISDWAKEAYAVLGDYVDTDEDDANPESPLRIIAPQKNATRYYVASLLHYIINFCTLYPSVLAEQYGFDKAMPVIDGSTSTYPFTQAVYGLLFANGQNHPSKPEKHSKSHASYQRLINGEADMIFASVYPASDILEMAEEKGVELELIPIAYDAMVFFTNADNSIEGLTSEQISSIYVNNAYKNWNEIGGPDALLYPYCRNNDSGSHAQMEKHFLKGSEIHTDIRAESTSKEMASILTDVIDAETSDPTGYALGYSIYYYYHNSDAVLGTKQYLKLLSIDGVQPNDSTIADGSYPLSNNTYVVLRKDTPKDAPARKMAEFMLTEAGQRCVEMAGFGRLKPRSDDVPSLD